jgi:hypothetical protein
MRLNESHLQNEMTVDVFKYWGFYYVAKHFSHITHSFIGTQMLPILKHLNYITPNQT